jgi:hypothetical protein
MSHRFARLATRLGTITLRLSTANGNDKNDSALEVFPNSVIPYDGIGKSFITMPFCFTKALPGRHQKSILAATVLAPTSDNYQQEEE